MIFYSDLTRPDFSATVLNPILDSMDDFLYPLNLYTAYNIADKNYATLKTFAFNNSSSNCGVSFYSQKISELTSDQINTAKRWLEINTLAPHEYSHVYVGSKSSLRNYFFSDFIPSAFDSLYSYLIRNNYIRQIGQGQGAAILFNSSLFSIPFSLPPQGSVDQFSGAIESFIQNFNSLKNDNEYLYNIILQKNQHIDLLNNKIAELEHKTYLDSRMTWR